MSTQEKKLPRPASKRDSVAFIVATYPSAITHTFTKKQERDANTCYESLKDDPINQAVILKDAGTGRIVRHSTGKVELPIKPRQPNMVMEPGYRKGKMVEVSTMTRKRPSAMRLKAGIPGRNNNF